MIVKYNDLPKFQVERALSPVLSFFVAPIVDSVLDTSGAELIVPEFPLKKNNNQSTNIDYLVADTNKKRVILVEFKTIFRASANSVLGHQEKYQDIVDKIRKITWAFLIEDLESITSGSSEKEKYGYLRTKAKKLETGFSDAHILYLVPDTTVVPFSGLPEQIDPDPQYVEDVLPESSEVPWPVRQEFVRSVRPKPQQLFLFESAR